MLGNEAFRSLDRIRGPTRRSGDSAHEFNIVAKLRHEIGETAEVRPGLLTGSMRHERSVGERPRDCRIDVPEFVNDRMELCEVTPCGGPRVCGIKGSVEDRAGDG